MTEDSDYSAAKVLSHHRVKSLIIWTRRGVIRGGHGVSEEEGSQSTNYGLKTSLKNHHGSSFAYFQFASHIPVLPMDASPFLLFFFSF